MGDTARRVQIALGILITVPVLVTAQGGDLKQEIVDGDPMVTVLPPDAIPAIHHPQFVAAGEAEEWMSEDELVLGVVGSEGEARAYSAWHLDRHEIVNDRIDGIPIAVTW